MVSSSLIQIRLNDDCPLGGKYNDEATRGVVIYGDDKNREDGPRANKEPIGEGRKEDCRFAEASCVLRPIE